MSTSNLKNLVLVGKLSISNWEAKRKAKSVEATAEAAAGAVHGAISARKSLLPGAEALEDIIKHSSAMRGWWNSVSAPWFDNGMRVYNVVGHFDIQVAYGDMARHRDSLIDKFLAEYPALREKARFDLNDLFDEEEYPMPGHVRSRFTCAFEVMPLPDVADFRVVQGLDPKEMTRLQAEAEAKVNARVSEAMATTVRRMLEAVQLMADRLAEYSRKEDADEKRQFYQSWVENVKEVAALLPQLNLTNDPKISQIAREIEESFSKPGLFYKSDATARQEATQKAKSIAAALASFFD